MADILHDFPVARPPAEVFAAVALPSGLDRWWTERSEGVPVPGAEYVLWFGPEYDWRAVVTDVDPGRMIEWRLIEALPDWAGTRVRIELEPAGEGTQVRFGHLGWAGPTEHFRISSYCWAMYLRILTRYLEHGETVPYQQRLLV